MQKLLKIGYASGLVWTPNSSSLIQLKTVCRKGSGRLAIDGDIGHDFLVSLERAVLLASEHTKQDLSKINLTITVPGMIDGTSAGLALFMSIYSAIMKRPIIRNIAFIGELSDTGHIIAIDKISDKLRAAKRANLQVIVIPQENFADIESLKELNMMIWGALSVVDAINFGFD